MFEKRGFATVNVRKSPPSADLNPHLYRYFATKEDVLQVRIRREAGH